MRQSALILTLIAILFGGVGLIHAQESDTVEITIFRDPNSLTIYMSAQGEVSLNGLTFEVVRRVGQQEQIITRPLHNFPEFRVLPFTSLTGPLCLRLEVHNTQSPAPLDCGEGELYLQGLNEDDVFWYDSSFNVNRLITVKSGGEPVDFCPEDCAIAYVPSPFTIPATIPGCAANIAEREVLVLIAQFDQLSTPDILPQREWESILNDAIKGLGDSVNARVFLLEDTILESHDEARAYSDLCQATLVIWGEIGRTKIKSAYTTTPRWSTIDTQPDEIIVKALSAAELPELEIFISSFGGDSPYVLQFVLGQLAYFDEEYDSALGFFNRALEYDLTGREIELGVHTVYFFSGFIHQEADNDLAGAIAAYDQAIALYPQFVNAYNNRGNAHRAQGNLARAIADLARAIALNPEYATGFYNRGNAFYYSGELTKAIDDYDQAIHLDPQSANAYNNRATAWSDLGDLAGAIADYNRAIDLDPDFDFAHNNRGTVYIDLGDPARAIVDFNQAIDLNPQFAEAFYNRGIAYKTLGDPMGAILDYNQAIDLDPQFALAYNNRGVAYSDLGDLERAIADYTQAIALDPDFAEAYNNRGNAHSDLGDLERAIADYTQAIALDPQLAEAFNGRGNVHLALGDLAAAITDFDQAIDLNPQFAEAFNGWGNVHLAQGDLAAAMTDFNRAIDLNPQFAEAFNSRGVVHAVRGNPAKAIADFDQAINLNPQFAEAFANRGAARWYLTDRTGAFSDLDQALILNPQYANTYGNLGNIYYDLEDFDQSLENYRHYLELTGDEAAPFVIERVQELEAMLGE